MNSEELKKILKKHFGNEDSFDRLSFMPKTFLDALDEAGYKILKVDKTDYGICIEVPLYMCDGDYLTFRTDNIPKNSESFIKWEDDNVRNERIPKLKKEIEDLKTSLQASEYLIKTLKNRLSHDDDIVVLKEKMNNCISTIDQLNTVDQLRGACKIKDMKIRKLQRKLEKCRDIVNDQQASLDAIANIAERE